MYGCKSIVNLMRKSDQITSKEQRFVLRLFAFLKSLKAREHLSQILDSQLLGVQEKAME